LANAPKPKKKKKSKIPAWKKEVVVKGMVSKGGTGEAKPKAKTSAKPRMDMAAMRKAAMGGPKITQLDNDNFCM
jgi:hypothetical protein